MVHTMWTELLLKDQALCMNNQHWMRLSSSLDSSQGMQSLLGREGEMHPPTPPDLLNLLFPIQTCLYGKQSIYRHMMAYSPK